MAILQQIFVYLESIGALAVGTVNPAAMIQIAAQAELTGGAASVIPALESQISTWVTNPFPGEISAITAILTVIQNKFFPAPAPAA